MKLHSILCNCPCSSSTDKRNSRAIASLGVHPNALVTQKGKLLVLQKGDYLITWSMSRGKRLHEVKKNSGDFLKKPSALLYAVDPTDTTDHNQGSSIAVSHKEVVPFYSRNEFEEITGIDISNE